MNNRTYEDFPNTTFSGVVLIIGCILLTVGAILRVDINFFFPDQIKAYIAEPFRIQFAYSCYILGWIFMFPAIVVLSRRISSSKPILGNLSVIMVSLGLFKRVFNSGTDHMAFLWAKADGADIAVQGISQTYGTLNVFHSLSMFLMFGWIVLALGSFISKELKLWQCLGIVLAVSMPTGVLKGTDIRGLISLFGLLVAFIPYGICLIREDKQKPKFVLMWIGISIIIIAISSIFGMLG